MYLLEFSKDGKLFNNEAYAIPAFRRVLDQEGYGEKLFYCLALSVDYKSPFNLYPEKDRLKLIFKQQFGKTQPDIPYKNKLVDECLEAYSAMQYDDLEEDYRTIRGNISDINEILSEKITLKTAEAVGKILMQKDKFIDQRQKIKGLIKERGALSDLGLSDKVVLSRLEMLYEKNKRIGVEGLR